MTAGGVKLKHGWGQAGMPCLANRTQGSVSVLMTWTLVLVMLLTVADSFQACTDSVGAMQVLLTLPVHWDALKESGLAHTVFKGLPSHPIRGVKALAETLCKRWHDAAPKNKHQPKYASELHCLLLLPVLPHATASA